MKVSWNSVQIGLKILHKIDLINWLWTDESKNHANVKKVFSVLVVIIGYTLFGDAEYMHKHFKDFMEGYYTTYVILMLDPMETFSFGLFSFLLW